MKKSSAKKAIERRKKRRMASPRHSSADTPRTSSISSSEELCQNCNKDLRGNERALFVEEEVGRIFCSEACIASYFTPEIERLEKEFFRRLSPSDLGGEDREKLAHLRWITLQQPDEVWREKTLTGDFRYTLISEFNPGQRKIWCVCICLFLRGEPSFLYLAFPTKNAAMVNHYRRGERIQLEFSEKGSKGAKKRKAKRDYQLPSDYGSPEMSEETVAEDSENSQKSQYLMDGLADAWTEDETLRAQLTQERREDDIPFDEFSLYQGCLEETLETPDEVWSLEIGELETSHLYHFIRHYPEETPGVWYVIVARETEDEDQIELLDAFPTRDAHLVDRYRRGKQEIGKSENRPISRVVH